MTLPLNTLAILSEEIFRIGFVEGDAAIFADEGGGGGNGKDLEHPASLSQFPDRRGDALETLVDQISSQLVTAVKKTVKRDSLFPRSWRNATRIASFVKSIATKTEENDFYDFVSSMDRVGLMLSLIHI